MKKTNNQLKQWLFNKPAVFTLLSFIFISVFILIYSLIASWLNINHEQNLLFGLVLFLLPFIYPVYYMIKKLPHDNMYRNDFIAIVNGSAIISFIFSMITIPMLTYYGNSHEQILWAYLKHPILFKTGVVLFAVLALYLLGLAISCVYAKYKRCKDMGITPWKIFLSMPFAFFMLWTPGYLIEEKTKKSNLEIKSKWYTNFNNWVLSNFNNVVFVFLFIALCRSLIAGVSTTILSIILLIIYTLWYVKHKSDFIKNINNGYALTAVGINIAIIAAIVIQFL